MSILQTYSLLYSNGNLWQSTQIPRNWCTITNYLQAMPTSFQTLLFCCRPYIYILVLPCGFLILPGSFTHFWPGLVGSPAYPLAHLKSREIIVRKWFFEKTKHKKGNQNNKLTDWLAQEWKGMERKEAHSTKVTP